MQTGYPVPDFVPTEADLCFCRSGLTFGACCGSQANDRKLPAGIQVFPGFVPVETCRKLVARLEKQPRERAEVTNVNRALSNAPIAHKTSGRICDEVRSGVLRKRIDNLMIKGFQTALKNTGHKLAWFETPTILRYESGGFYHRHADSCQVVQPGNRWHKVRDRDLSLLLYLNDDYTGGGLSFIHFKYHFRPKTGDMLVFPSDNRYEHRAEEVTSGLRYAVASWAALAGTRRIFDQPPHGAVLLPT